MGHRLSRIYTRTGDAGTTGLGDGTRADKDTPRIEAYGAVDELNSHIGMILTFNLPSEVHDCLNEIQHSLFDLGGELCIPGHRMITPEYADWLEKWLDYFNDDLPMLKEFILPGGNQAAAACHIARTVCRRAERRLVSLNKHESINPQALVYLNRLSDLLFVFARVLARQHNGDEVLWRKSRLLGPPR
jgi:cob(I)alamin adenosyltransferase